MRQAFSYPDISDVIARKERGRRARAALSYAEKLVMLDRLRETADSFAAARRSRLSGGAAPSVRPKD